MANCDLKELRKAIENGKEEHVNNLLNSSPSIINAVLDPVRIAFSVTSMELCC
jgi:hypothetical protein